MKSCVTADLEKCQTVRFSIVGDTELGETAFSEVPLLDLAKPSGFSTVRSEVLCCKKINRLREA